MQVIFRVAGTGVTPFGPANQERLIQVLAYGAGNISSSAFRIILVADAYSSRRRALLSWHWEGLLVSRFANLGASPYCCSCWEGCSSCYMHMCILVMPNIRPEGVRKTAIGWMSISNMVPRTRTLLEEFQQVSVLGGLSLGWPYYC